MKLRKRELERRGGIMWKRQNTTQMRRHSKHTKKTYIGHLYGTHIHTPVHNHTPIDTITRYTIECTTSGVLWSFLNPNTHILQHIYNGKITHTPTVLIPESKAQAHISSFWEKLPWEQKIDVTSEQWIGRYAELVSSIQYSGRSSNYSTDLSW